MNTEHYEAGTPGGKGGQFAPKNKSLNGGFSKENQSFNNEDKLEPLKRRQNISTYKHYQAVIRSVLRADFLEDLNPTILKNMFDVCASSPIFDTLFLDEVISSNKQYINDYGHIINIANDEDDKSGIDFVLGKENGGVSRFDLKANYSAPGKIRLILDTTMIGGIGRQARDEVKDGFLLKKDSKTNYYAFMSVDNAHLNSRYNQKRILTRLSKSMAIPI